jgi:hypothetical protein
MIKSSDIHILIITVILHDRWWIVRVFISFHIIINEANNMDYESFPSVCEVVKKATCCKSGSLNPSLN